MHGGEGAELAVPGFLVLGPDGACLLEVEGVSALSTVARISARNEPIFPSLGFSVDPDRGGFSGRDPCDLGSKLKGTFDLEYLLLSGIESDGV